MKRKLIEWLWLKFPSQDRKSQGCATPECRGIIADNGSFVPYGTLLYWWWRRVG